MAPYIADGDVLVQENDNSLIIKIHITQLRLFKKIRSSILEKNPTEKKEWQNTQKERRKKQDKFFKFEEDTSMDSPMNSEDF